VTDNDGATGSTTQEVYLQEPPSSPPPTASFAVACTDLHCTFSDQSTPVAGSLVRWEWNFGDGSVLSMSAAPVNPAHSYPGPGSYQVRLTVVDEFGAVGEATRDVVVDGIGLSAQAVRVRGSGRVDLKWSGADGASVRIVLNGADLATVPNTGEYRHEVANRSKSGFRFQVCETSGSRCSAEVSVKL
jgi:PKD repeat protein